MADLFRILVIALCGWSLGLAFAETKLYLRRWRKRDMYGDRLKFIVTIRVGIALTAIYTAITVGSRLQNPTLSWRSVVAGIIMALFIVGMLGILRDDERFQDLMKKLDEG